MPCHYFVSIASQLACLPLHCHSQAGLGLLRQLYFGAMDIELHSPQYDPFGEKSIFQLQQEMAPKYAVIPPLADDRFLCSFGHIFAGGYSAGYYSYKWAGKGAFLNSIVIAVF